MARQAQQPDPSGQDSGRPSDQQQLGTDEEARAVLATEARRACSVCSSSVRACGRTGAAVQGVSDGGDEPHQRRPLRAPVPASADPAAAAPLQARGEGVRPGSGPAKSSSSQARMRREPAISTGDDQDRRRHQASALRIMPRIISTPTSSERTAADRIFWQPPWSLNRRPM